MSIVWGKLHSSKFCIFSFIGFLKSSPHSSHCTVEVVYPTRSLVCYGLNFQKRGKKRPYVLYVSVSEGSADLNGCLLSVWLSTKQKYLGLFCMCVVLLSVLSLALCYFALSHDQQLKIESNYKLHRASYLGADSLWNLLHFCLV